MRGHRDATAMAGRPSVHAEVGRPLAARAGELVGSCLMLSLIHSHALEIFGVKPC